MILNCVVEEDSWDSLGQKEDQTSQLWIFTGRTDAESKAPILWHLMWRTDPLEKTLTLGKTEGRRRRGWQRAQWLGGITDSMEMNLSKLQEMVKDKEAWCSAVHGATKSPTWLSNWTTISLLSWNYFKNINVQVLLLSSKAPDVFLMSNHV